MVLQILLATIFILFLTNIFRIYRFIRLCLIYYKLPGPEYFPVFGIALRFALVKENGILELFQKISEGRRSSSLMVVGRPYTILSYPSDLERAMASKEHISKGMEYDAIKLWLNTGLLTSDGKKWHNRRKILTPTFHFKILEDSLSTMNQNAIKLVTKLLSYNKQAIEVDNFVSLCSLDIICETAMGINLNSQDNKSVEYVRDIRRACRIVVIKEKTFWMRNNLIFRYSPIGKEFFEVMSRLHAFTEKVIAERRELIKGSGNNRSEGLPTFILSYT